MKGQRNEIAEEERQNKKAQFGSVSSQFHELTITISI